MKTRKSTPKPTMPEDAVVRLDELCLAPQWRAWLLARVTEEGSLASALRAVISEAALADIFRMQYEKEQELRRRLRLSGRSEDEMSRLIADWRNGDPIEGVMVGPPAAARILHPGVVSRVPQIRRVRTASDRQRQAAGSPRRSEGSS